MLDIWKKCGNKEEYHKDKRENMLFIWQKLRQNKKSLRTPHPASLTYSTSQTKWDMETWMSKARHLSAMMLESCAWMTGLGKRPANSNMSSSQI